MLIPSMAGAYPSRLSNGVCPELHLGDRSAALANTYGIALRMAVTLSWGLTPMNFDKGPQCCAHGVDEGALNPYTPCLSSFPVPCDGLPLAGRL